LSIRLRLLVFLVVSFLLPFPPMSYIHSFSPHSCYIPCPSHPPWIDHSNYVFSNLPSLHLSWDQIFSSAPCSQTPSVYKLTALLLSHVARGKETTVVVGLTAVNCWVVRLGHGSWVFLSVLRFASFCCRVNCNNLSDLSKLCYDQRSELELRVALRPSVYCQSFCLDAKAPWGSRPHFFCNCTLAVIALT
jgi:hypothetical protein